MFRDWKSIFGVLAVFALGGVAGVLLAFIVVHHRVGQLMRPGSPAYEQMVERRLSRGLHLDADQRERFHAALAANIEARKKLQQQIQPQVQQLNLETRREMGAILSPGQRETFHRNLQDFRRRFGVPGLGGGPVQENATIGATNAAPASD